MWSVVTLRWVLAAVMLATACYHGARIVTVQLARRRAAGPAVASDLDVDIAHAAMGVGMALMLTGSLGASTVWIVGFAVAALWFAARAVGGYVLLSPAGVGNHTRQTLACCGMLGMLAIPLVSAGASAGSGSAMSMAGMAMPATATVSPETVAVVILLVAMAGLSAWTANGLRPAARSGCRPTLAPSVTAGCQLAANVTAVYMLAAML